MACDLQESDSPSDVAWHQPQVDGDLDMKTTVSMLFAFCIVSIVGCAADTSPSTLPSTGDNAEMQALLEEFPEATQIDDHSISWNDGKVVLVLQNDDAGEASAEAQDSEPSSVVGSSQALPPNAHGCPVGFYCVYTHRNWNVGAPPPPAPTPRRLQFSDCSRNDLSDHHFQNQASSWVNNGSHIVEVRNDRRPLQPDEALWIMLPHDSRGYVGDADNDKADFFQCL
jgi:hypothetical protein